ncbi:MAG TPA: hypothetical protein VIT85_08230 [Solirubrobacterales bacterium]
MAETKTKKASKAKPKRKPAKKAAKKAAATRKSVKKAAAKRKPASNGSKPRSSSNGSSGHGVSSVVGKAALPLVAGGAALAGVVGGAALGAKRSGRKVLGVPMPKPKRVQFRTKDLSKAAKEVGGFGEHVGDLASELRRAQDAVSNGKANSPVEILLQGLTRRR